MTPDGVLKDKVRTGKKKRGNGSEKYQIEKALLHQPVVQSGNQHADQKQSYCMITRECAAGNIQQKATDAADNCRGRYAGHRGNTQCDGD